MCIFLFILPESEVHIDSAPVPLRIDTLAPSSLECQNDERSLPESLPA